MHGSGQCTQFFSIGKARQIFPNLSNRKALGYVSRISLRREGPNTGSGRYSLGADTKLVDKVRIWYQAGLVTA